MSFTTKIESNHYLRLNEVAVSLGSLGNLRLKDLHGDAITSAWKDLIGISLSYVNKVDFKRTFKTAIEVIPTINKNMKKDLTIELDLIVNPITKNDFVRNFKVGIEFKVGYTTVNAFNRTFPVVIEISEQHQKNITAPKKTTLELSLLKVSNAGQIISDIRFYDKILNETNFDEIFTPFGYSKWKQMITGDYIYEKALCKYVMQASLNADRPNTRVYVHKVDVPDVTDRGTIQLTTKNQPYEVHFSKDRKFHIVPELNTTIKSYSGTGSSPIIIPYNVTTTGFMLLMKNEDGGYVEGSVTYAARGY